MVEDCKNREDIYGSKVVKKDSEIDPDEKRIIKNILLQEISK